MALKPCSLKINVRQHEIDSRGTPMFPCGGYVAAVGDFTDSIPWHWHEEVEIMVVTSGALKLDVPTHTYLLREGEAVFVNSSVLHTAVSAQDSICTIQSFVFAPKLIFGALESAIEQKYVRPFVNCPLLCTVHFQNDLQWHMDAIENMMQAFDHYQRQPFGYEMLVRDSLSKLWYLMASNLQEELKQHHSAANREVARVKDMLDFIHNHYTESIGLSSISKAASISDRECLRCFHKVLGTTPMKYLLSYRVSVAAGLLLTSAMSITEIYRCTGFESPSYFSLKFKSLTDMTPREYRQRGKQGA